MKFVIECYMDVHPKPDDDGIGVIKYDQYLYQVDHIKKSDIFWIKSSFNNELEIWTAEWFFNNQDSYINFETEKEMRVFEKKILDWWRS